MQGNLQNYPAVASAYDTLVGIKWAGSDDIPVRIPVERELRTRERFASNLLLRQPVLRTGSGECQFPGKPAAPRPFAVRFRVGNQGALGDFRPD